MHVNASLWRRPGAKAAPLLLPVLARACACQVGPRAGDWLERRLPGLPGLPVAADVVRVAISLSRFFEVGPCFASDLDACPSPSAWTIDRIASATTSRLRLRLSPTRAQHHG